MSGAERNGATPPLQLESLAGFSAVIDRLGEFEEVVKAPEAARLKIAAASAMAAGVHRRCVTAGHKCGHTCCRHTRLGRPPRPTSPLYWHDPSS